MTSDAALHHNCATCHPAGVLPAAVQLAQGHIQGARWSADACVDASTTPGGLQQATQGDRGQTTGCASTRTRYWVQQCVCFRQCVNTIGLAHNDGQEAAAAAVNTNDVPTKHLPWPWDGTHSHTVIAKAKKHGISAPVAPYIQLCTSTQSTVPGRLPGGIAKRHWLAVCSLQNDLKHSCDGWCIPLEVPQQCNLARPQARTAAAEYSNSCRHSQLAGSVSRHQPADKLA